MSSLVSIIVPIYNVEKYLTQCLESISNQTFSDIQVILVNDGSPDNSLIICEEFCRKDCRFELVNKKNGGLASARNAGLERVKGKYIICVDSDDWVELSMVEILLKNIINCNADMSVCSFYVNNTKGEKKEFFSNKIDVLSQEETIKRIITPGKFYGFAWNKMYRTDLLANQRFDETILKGEDSPFTCEYALKCKKIVVQDIPLYHYRNDTVSISRSKFNMGKMSVLTSYQCIIDMLIKANYSPEIIEMQKVQYANQLLSLRTNIVSSEKEKYALQLSRIDDEMKQYEKIYLRSRYIDCKHKVAYELGLRLKSFFDYICRVYRGVK